MRFFNFVGSTVFLVLNIAGGIFLVIADSFRLFFKPPIRFKLLVKQIEFVGYRSLPIVILTGIFIGMIFTLQSYHGLEGFGATELTSGLVTTAIVGELSPVLASIMVAARAGSAMTAEIATMKVTEQVDALESMGVDPMHYLGVPRLLASLLSFPLINAICIVCAEVGAYIVAIAIKGDNPEAFLDNATTYVDIIAFLKSSTKAAIFGLLMGAASCYNGLNAKNSAEGVGIATTLSVVETCVLILMFDYLLSSIMMKTFQVL